MTTPYPTGCGQMCNSGADCTETTMHCKKQEAGNVFFVGEEPEELLPPMTISDKFVFLIVMITSGGLAVSVINLMLDVLAKHFFK